MTDKRVVVTADARYIYVDVVNIDTGRIDPLRSDKFHASSDKVAIDYAWELTREDGIAATVEDRRKQE